MRENSIPYDNFGNYIEVLRDSQSKYSKKYEDSAVSAPKQIKVTLASHDDTTLKNVIMDNLECNLAGYQKR